MAGNSSLLRSTFFWSVTARHVDPPRGARDGTLMCIHHLFHVVGPHESCTCGQCDASRLHTRLADKSTHVTGWRDPTYRVAAAIKGSSHRVDQHGTCHVQVHDATRGRRRCEPGGAHAFAGACVTFAWHTARACKVCAPSSVALASIELALARACAGAVQSTGSTRGTSPHPCRQWREQRTWGARGAHPRTPALLQADDLPGSKMKRTKMRLGPGGRSFHGWA